ncbi:unnamed protein product, partial [Taenia asiatica]|uniref:Galactosylgalactosylxylosylprotein 3-beta-glucuronosyltransferase n=1 Tax=Taenia asiatica TaxID=60517 RepID=A0A0R3VZD2_TAEAS
MRFALPSLERPDVAPYDQSLRVNSTQQSAQLVTDEYAVNEDVWSSMRTLKRGATWPVGLAASSDWGGCITNPANGNKISCIWSNYKSDRKFPIDMAASAVNLNL